MEHGTRNAYNAYGCRCDPCRAAQREYQRAWKRGHRGSPPSAHGTATGYTLYGCRCQPCKEAESIYMRGWKRANRDRMRAIILKRKYGTTPAEMAAILDGQGGGCAICEKPLDLTNAMYTQPDHSHVTGRLRGVLCRTCNAGLGMFADAPERLRRAADYLEHHQRSALRS